MAKEIGSKKTGGRRKGTPNKKSEFLFDVLNKLNFNVPEHILKLLPELPQEKQADILLDLMAYIYPKRKALEQFGDSQTVSQILVSISSNEPTEAELQVRAIELEKKLGLL